MIFSKKNTNFTGQKIQESFCDMKTTVIQAQMLETMYENNFLLLMTINANINIIKKTQIKD